jgi:hypothetical protein
MLSTESLDALSTFLNGLAELSEQTGVTLAHYESVVLSFGTEQVRMSGEPDENGRYGLEVS